MVRHTTKPYYTDKENFKAFVLRAVPANFSLSKKNKVSKVFEYVLVSILEIKDINNQKKDLNSLNIPFEKLTSKT